MDNKSEARGATGTAESYLEEAAELE